ANTRPNVSCDGMPCSRSRKVASNSFLAFPNRSIAAKESAPHRTASKAMTSTLTSGCARVRSIRGSDTSERYSITDALISFCSSLIVISWTRFGRAQEIMRRGHAQAVLASDRKRSIFDAIALPHSLTSIRLGSLAFNGASIESQTSTVAYCHISKSLWHKSHQRKRPPRQHTGFVRTLTDTASFLRLH